MASGDSLSKVCGRMFMGIDGRTYSCMFIFVSGKRTTHRHVKRSVFNGAVIAKEAVQHTLA